MTFYGIEEKDIVSRNFKNNTFDISIPDFHKSEMATAKMLLKMALESIAKSQNQILLKYNFIELKNYINNISTQDWPFIVTKILKLYDFKSIPKFNDKHNLNRIKCKLLLFEFSEDILLFEFQYDYISLVINLLDRTYSWSERYFQLDNLVSLYPTYLNKKPNPC